MVGMRSQKKYNLIKDTFSDKVFLFLMYCILSFALVVVLYPLIYIVSASFSSPGAVVSGKVWLLPVDPTLIGYEAVFKNQQIMVGFLNSFYYMIVGTSINIVMTMLCAFPLSRKEFYGKSFISIIFIFTMYFSGGLVPGYILVSKLGMLDTRWAMLIPGAMSVWNVIIARTYLQSNIHDEMFEAASMDGCSEFRFLWRIIFPLSAPIIAVLALYYGIGHWNSYFNAMIYLKSPSLFPLQIALRNLLIMGTVDPTMLQDFDALQRRQGLSDLLKYAVIVVASVPVMCIYPFVQKYFVKGVMVGSLKG